MHSSAAADSKLLLLFAFNYFIASYSLQKIATDTIHGLKIQGDKGGRLERYRGIKGAD